MGQIDVHKTIEGDFRYSTCINRSPRQKKKINKEARNFDQIGLKAISTIFHLTECTQNFLNTSHFRP
jgi:hypothetical protein